MPSLTSPASQSWTRAMAAKEFGFVYFLDAPVSKALRVLKGRGLAHGEKDGAEDTVWAAIEGWPLLLTFRFLFRRRGFLNNRTL